MKRIFKITLIILVVIVLLLGGTGFYIFNFFNKTYLDFESDYSDKPTLEQLTVDGYTFPDRNGNGTLDVYEDDRKPIAERVADVLSQMTIEEKLHLLKGSGLASAMGQGDPDGIAGAVGTIVPTPRLGLPTIFLSDGPAGLRIQPTREGDKDTYYCTAFPIATLLASTWNEDLVYQVGDAMGTEAMEYGIDVILGPGANIHRHPLCGRNFEYYSEDPLLTGYMGAAVINGIESNGVGTSVKHYVANNQETDRNFNDAILSERALREIYLKGFEILVKEAQPWTIMSSYNKVNGTYTSQSRYLLTDILREDWGFEGLVMTDWFGGRNVTEQIMAGNDLLEPGTKKQWDALIEAQADGSLTMEAIDTSVSRILELILNSRKMENYAFSNDPDLKAHAEVTRQSAAEGMVLLKNEGALPLAQGQNVALLGVTSYEFIAGGTGSGDVNEAYTISLEEGLENAGFSINQQAKVVYQAHRDANPKGFVKPEGMDVIFSPYDPPEIRFTEAQLKEIVNSSDVGILTIGRNSGEGGDRVEKDDFLLSDLEQEMITMISEAYQSANKQLVVVLNIGGVIETASWNGQPDAILLAWQGGQEGGNSVADILSGKVNPSGKLPMTFPVKLSDHASDANFPKSGEQWSAGQMFMMLLAPPEERPEADWVRNKDYTHYDEGVYVGYRHFDKQAMEVAYPFGYGLSYTNFEYGEMRTVLENDTITIFVTIQNSGEVAGKEVVQLYSEKLNTTIDRPVQELKAFAKSKALAPGETQELQFTIAQSELSYWDEEKKDWVVEGGEYAFKLGVSSRDIRKEFVVDLIL
ncbi:MAG: glycoside hydrolase family 3 C-terminal domain-containing protein [Cytophagales bacterium]|nr:glycoside hydrolase family 3 C-terminal domain-containing protein [Cytophagales bacterium]